MILSPTIVLALLFLAGTALVVARRIQQRVGIPWSHDIRADDAGALPTVPLMIDDELQLVGKPDYIVRRGADLVPVEVKPLRRATRPYESDIYQLLAYCLLIERTYGQRPPYGLLRYATRTFRIDYDDDMAASVIDIVMQMHTLHDVRDVPRSHNSVTRCRSCGFWQQCDQSLVVLEE
jgi:CRISPR-associated exonuclease Cas4